MRAKGYVRSESYPRFFRTASKNNYVRVRSNFGRQNSNRRSTSKHNNNQGQSGDYRPGSSNRSGTRNARSGSKLFEKPKGDLFKMIETMEKKFEKFEKAPNEMKEILKNKFISTQFVVTEIIIDVKCVHEGTE